MHKQTFKVDKTTFTSLFKQLRKSNTKYICIKENITWLNCRTIEKDQFCAYCFLVFILAKYLDVVAMEDSFALKRGEEDNKM